METLAATSGLMLLGVEESSTSKKDCEGQIDGGGGYKHELLCIAMTLKLLEKACQRMKLGVS